MQGLTESRTVDRGQGPDYYRPVFLRQALSVALVSLLDQSGSLREIISQQREAALALFRRFSDRSSIAVLKVR